MTSLNIVYHPDPRLKIKTQPIRQVNDEIRKIAKEMIEAMYIYDGVGLAATQVGIKHQIFVLDVSEEKNNPQVFLNPTIIESRNITLKQEACISFPGISVEVSRAEEITVEYLTVDGKIETLKADGLLAHCIQHETDHLNGITMLDHLSRLKRDRASKKVMEYIKSSKDIA